LRPGSYHLPSRWRHRLHQPRASLSPSPCLSSLLPGPHHINPAPAPNLSFFSPRTPSRTISYPAAPRSRVTLQLASFCRLLSTRHQLRRAPPPNKTYVSFTQNHTARRCFDNFHRINPRQSPKWFSGLSKKTRSYAASTSSFSHQILIFPQLLKGIFQFCEIKNSAPLLAYLAKQIGDGTSHI
jgi:hypothetical protein